MARSGVDLRCLGCLQCCTYRSHDAYRWLTQAAAAIAGNGLIGTDGVDFSAGGYRVDDLQGRESAPYSYFPEGYVQ